MVSLHVLHPTHLPTFQVCVLSVVRLKYSFLASVCSEKREYCHEMSSTSFLKLDKQQLLVNLA